MRRRLQTIFTTCPFCGDECIPNLSDTQWVTTKRHTKNYFHKACYEASLEKQRKKVSS